MLREPGKRVGAHSSSGIDDVDDVSLQSVVQEDAPGHLLEESQIFEGDGLRINGLLHSPSFDAVKNLKLFQGLWVGDDFFHQEAVHLCFGKHVGSFFFNGVLSCHHHEGLGQRIDNSTDGGLAFLHGLEHGRLGLCR